MVFSDRQTDKLDISPWWEDKNKRKIESQPNDTPYTLNLYKVKFLHKDFAI